MRKDVVARVRLISTAEGGRAGATPADNWGCLLAVADVMLDCRLLLGGVGPLVPGHEATVPIAFLSPDIAREHLAVGTRFTLWEAGTVGEGEIVSVSFPNQVA